MVPLPIAAKPAPRVSPMDLHRRVCSSLHERPEGTGVVVPQAWFPGEASLKRPSTQNPHLLEHFRYGRNLLQGKLAEGQWFDHM